MMNLVQGHDGSGILGLDPAERSRLAGAKSVPRRSPRVRLAGCGSTSGDGAPGVARLTFENGPRHLDVVREEEEPRLPGACHWSDAQLVTAARRDPPDQMALDTLVDRHWKSLFGRCQMLTLNRQRAGDLAQEAWRRVLRARHSLKPDGNFPAYLATVATNLWRDTIRSERRAGPMAEHRMASLNAPLSDEEGETLTLMDVLPEPSAMGTEEQRQLALDLDAAMERLTPHLRDVLVARFIAGESCAEIGRRYDRTEQSVSGWVRQAIRELRAYFRESDRGSTLKPNS